MFKKLLFCIALLMTFNSKVYSHKLLLHTFNNSMRPTGLLTAIASLGILANEQDKDLIAPLVGITGLSTLVSGITCFSLLKITKTFALWNCTNKCNTRDLRCSQHSPDDYTVGQFLLEGSYRHSHRLGILAGLVAGGAGYVWYKNHYA